ncbi:glycosyltransferase family 2 protein [Curtobacterium sp. BRD11]|uniref:glycosyltransferase family 2 protein n=1 Tax=Curtobacterium sp. BRD11 TaxID=2962581 RepID=UPI0037C06920
MFSVVLPTVGGEHLKYAVRSVLRQSSAPNLVLVDDRRASGRDLRYACPELEEVARLSVLVTGGVGLAGARNIGLDEAGSAPVAFLDDDDVWCPHHLARVSDALSSPEAKGFAWSGSRVVTYGNGRAALTTAGFGWPNVFSALQSTNVIPPSSAAVSSGRWVSFDQRRTELEDWDAWLNLLRDGHEPSFTGVVTMGYGRNVASKASMTMAATADRSRQEAMALSYEEICESHPVLEGAQDIRSAVREFRRLHAIQAETDDGLEFDYYELSVESLFGRPSSPLCCDFDYAGAYLAES